MCKEIRWESYHSCLESGSLWGPWGTNPVNEIPSDHNHSAQQPRKWESGKPRRRILTGFFCFFFKHPFWSDDYYVTNLSALKIELGSTSPFFTSPVRVSCPLISYLWPGLPGPLIHLLCDCVRPRAKRGHVPISFLSVSIIFPGRSMYVSGKKNHLFPRRCLSVTILLWSE